MSAGSLRTSLAGRTRVVALVAVMAVLLFGTTRGRRTLSASCPACSSSAASLCATQSAAEVQRNQGALQSACGSYSPQSCCGLRHSGSWEGVSACACAGQVVSGVQMSVVENVCGCASSSDRSVSLPDLSEVLNFPWGLR